MRIIYGFSNCSYKKYHQIMAGSKVMVLQQAQKYHSLMTAGLAANGCDVLAISGLPVNRHVSKKFYTRGGDDIERDVNFHYFGAINLPGFRQITLIVKSFVKTLLQRKIDVAICDILNISTLIGMLGACRIRGKKIIGIVTDVPGKLASDKVTAINRLDAWLMQRMDGYILLTKAMNELVNPHGKPYVVIEGQVDSQMKLTNNDIARKDYPKVIMYAGSMQRIYGLPRLVEAFRRLDPEGWELHIYGDGDFRQELQQSVDHSSKVKYLGIHPNDKVVEAEMRATLLVNPRPTNEEFTRYSFPSKNMEYMASGTPILTTHLPGMPQEYLEHVYLLNDESTEGIYHTLQDVLKNSSESLHQKGTCAKRFVLERKNETVQSAKAIQLFKSVTNCND